MQVRITAKQLSLILTTECTEIPPLVKVKFMEAQLTSDRFPEDEMTAEISMTGTYILYSIHMHVSRSTGSNT